MTVTQRAGVALSITKGASWPPFAITSTSATPGEHADNPHYPEKYSALGFRIGVNYVIYGMTH